MIIKIRPNGYSFAGLNAYLKQDAGAKTSERVAWTHTLNCASDNADEAVDEMLWTARNAELLKAEAGIRPGGSKAERPVKHVMLSWAQDEDPSREHMIETTLAYLARIGAEEHQAVLFCHSDKEHAHVHVMLNRINPETGLTLRDSFDYRRSQAFALQYEREQGRIYCEERLKPEAERAPSPNRSEWEALKKSEAEFLRGEAELRKFDPNYLERGENRKVTNSEEWKILKEFQRAEREDYFAAGKSEFKELRNEIYREVREEFRERWAEAYALKREDPSGQAFAEKRAEILAEQRATLDERRTEACATLRADRDIEYRALLDAQKDMRTELIERQEEGLSSPHLLDLLNRVPETALRDERADFFAQPDMRPEFSKASIFNKAADEVFSRADDQSSTLIFEGDDEFSPAPASPAATRPGLDIAGNLGMGMMGGIAVIGESLFDGFFGWSPTPAQDRAAKPERVPPPQPEFPAPNPFLAYAEEARRAAERRQDEQDRVWWDERRARSRD